MFLPRFTNSIKQPPGQKPCMVTGHSPPPPVGTWHAFYIVIAASLIDACIWRHFLMYVGYVVLAKKCEPITHPNYSKPHNALALWNGRLFQKNSRRHLFGPQSRLQDKPLRIQEVLLPESSPGTERVNQVLPCCLRSRTRKKNVRFQYLGSTARLFIGFSTW